MASKSITEVGYLTASKITPVGEKISSQHAYFTYHENFLSEISLDNYRSVTKQEAVRPPSRYKCTPYNKKNPKISGWRADHEYHHHRQQQPNHHLLPTCHYRQENEINIKMSEIIDAQACWRPMSKQIRLT